MSEYIVRMPSDMPYEIKAELNAWYINSEPIVRCRDCKHMETRGQRRYCGAHAGGYPEVMLDDFCSWGEGREDS